MRHSLHPAAFKGFSSAAPTYVRGRPEYPPEITSWLEQKLEVAPGKTIVDLGAGTGKFTKFLVQTGANVIAIEPVESMRNLLSANLPSVMSKDGTAQVMPLEDSSCDVVVCAQAFHWFAITTVLTEIHRVLRPEGKLGLIWNVRDESIDWVAAITNIIAPYEGDTPRMHTGLWRRPFTGELFTELSETCFSYRHIGSAEEVIVDRVLSISFIAALPDADKMTVTDKLHALIDSHPDLKGRDSIAFPYQTRAYWCARKAEQGR